MGNHCVDTHWLHCTRFKSNEISKRHNAVLNLVARWLNAAKIVHKTEVNHNNDHKDNKRPDLCIWLTSGEVYYADVTITHPCTPSRLARFGPFVGPGNHHPSRKNIYAPRAHDAKEGTPTDTKIIRWSANNKTSKYEALCNIERAGFLPLVLESLVV